MGRGREVSIRSVRVADELIVPEEDNSGDWIVVLSSSG